jgi:hypothetical protein
MMDQTSLEKRRSSLRIGLVIGLIVLIWYLVAMFVVLQP